MFYERKLQRRYDHFLGLATEATEDNHIDVLRKCAAFYHVLDKERHEWPGMRTEVGMLQHRFLIRASKELGVLPRELRALKDNLEQSEFEYVYHPVPSRSSIDRQLVAIRSGLNIPESDFNQSFQEALHLSEDVSDWDDAFDLKKADRKRVKRYAAQSRSLMLAASNRHSYGMPSSPKWELMLETPEQARADLRQREKMLPPSQRGNLHYLFNKSHQMYSEWILYFVGEVAKPVFAMMGVHRYPWPLRCGDEHLPGIVPALHLGDCEKRFGEDREYLEPYRKSLNEFLHSDYFRQTTGYSQMIVTGIEKLSATEARAMSWHTCDLQKRGRPDIWGINLANARSPFDVTNESKGSLSDVLGLNNTAL